MVAPKEIIKATIYENEDQEEGREYKGRFIGVINKKQASAIFNSVVLQKRLIHMETKVTQRIGVI